MSSISSIYAQSMSSLYEATNIYKNPSTSSASSSDNTTTASKEDTLTISDEGMSLLQSLMEAQETSSENESTDDSKNHEDLLSQLQDLFISDKLSEEDKSDIQDILEEIKEKLESKLDDLTNGKEASSSEGTRPMMPPPPPKPTTQDNSEEADDNTSYTLNIDDLVSSGLITQTQADTIKSALDKVNE